jgi:hypothetical protein
MNGGFALAHAHITFQVVEHHALMTALMGSLDQPFGRIKVFVSG